MFESRCEFSVPIEFSRSANLQEVSSALQTRSHRENRYRSSKQHFPRFALKALVHEGMLAGSLLFSISVLENC